MIPRPPKFLETLRVINEQFHFFFAFILQKKTRDWRITTRLLVAAMLTKTAGQPNVRPTTTKRLAKQIEHHGRFLSPVYSPV